MAQDEGCFGRISTPKRCWAPPGVRPQAPRQVVREYVYAYTAVAPEQGAMTSLMLPYANTAMMPLFLDHVSKTFADRFIVMQVDRAGWHTATARQSGMKSGRAHLGGSPREMVPQSRIPRLEQGG